MTLVLLILFSGLLLSLISAYYSIIGLMAIFSAAPLSIMIMGGGLEIAKLVVTVWLKVYWSRASRFMKTYLTFAVSMLMLITSIGCFGFLSKAHLDQNVVSGEVTTKIAIYDEKIKSSKDNIETNRRALKQMDDAVEQLMSRTTDEQGATKAANLRRNQQGERTRLQNEIAKEQQKIQQLSEERAPIAAEVRKVEAEVGPIKYIAALIYGDNPDANLLEKAVRWVIIILVVVFDPLAIFMLLAATESYRWEREKSQPIEEHEEEPDDATVPDDEITADDMDAQPPGDILEPEPITTLVGQPEIEYQILDDADDEAELPPPQPVPESLDYEAAQKTVQTAPTKESEWEGADADNNSRLYFGPVWPRYPSKGDLFLKINTLPTTLYKFNGEKWIDTDKTLTDRYAFNPQYIDYLIRKIGTGEYDPELLTDAERGQIELRLKQDLR